MKKNDIKKTIPFKELVFENASLIEASAGTGKTYTVSAIVLRAVLGIWLNEKQNNIPPMDITKIVLMTFTNAATADLKRKVFEKIHEVKLDLIKSLDDEFYKPTDEISSFILEQYKGREAEAITLFEQCEYKSSEVQVKTIHGFARSVLSSNSLDTNLDQEYELQSDISKLKTKALINEIRKVVFDVKKYNLKELLNFDCSKFCHYEYFELTCELIKSYIDSFKKSIISLVEENGAKNFEVYNRNTINSDCFINSGLSAKLYQKLNRNEHSMQQKISLIVDWMVEELEKEGEESLWKGKFKNQKQLKLNNIFEATTKQIIHYIYLQAFENLEKIKDINKYITIDDLLLKLESALKNDKTGALAKSIRNKFPLIIVDEFQDTDDVQLSIFKSIYLNNIKAESKDNVRDKNIEILVNEDSFPISNGDNREENSISCFIAVGDPKQSIYMFRGANIYGYQNIRNQINDEIGKLYTLDTNFRSSQKLIYATNLLFNVNNIDLFSEQKINFEDVKANKLWSNQKAVFLSEDIEKDLKKDNTELKELFTNIPACYVNFITSGTPDLSEENQTSKSKSSYKDVDSVTKSCVLKIIELLKKGYLISDKGVDRKIRLSDIVILVRSIKEYKIIYRALIEKGIPSVYLSNKEKIIDTDEYKAILYLMKAVCTPKSRGCIRQLVGSIFFNCNCAEFERIVSDDVIEKVISLLSECNDIWHRNGFLKMLNHFLSEGVKLNKDAFINNRSNSEIMLTNILHIAEVIQPICDKYGSNLSIENIIQESEDLLVSNDNVDESENVTDSSGLTIRATATSNLLKIYTHHKSKGLEYNIVFIPYMIEIMDKNKPIDKGPKYIDYYSQSNEEIKKFYEICSIGSKNCDHLSQLKLAYDNYKIQAGYEDLRLAYVAYTRAKYAMYLWTQNFKEVCQTYNPLEKRLCDIEDYMNDEQYYENDGNNVSFSKIFSFKNFTKLDVEQEWFNEPICTERELGKEEIDLEQYEVKECREKYKSNWKTTSFSSLTINSHNNHTPHTVVQIDEDVIDDETQNVAELSLTNVKERTYSSLFPKGAEAGTFLHAIFEKISFKNDFIKNFDNLSEKEVLNTRLAKVVKQQIQLTKFDKNYGSAECREGEEYSSLYMLVNWVNDVLQTPLVKGEDFSLSDVDDDCVFKEHEFFISLAQGDKLFSCNKLSDLFNEYNRQMLEDNRQAFFLPTDTVTKSDFDFENVQGFLKGYIDLFFMYKNKYYILDYKSNFLGEDYSDYNDDSLRQSIASSCYYLQYSLYTVAMNRFLKQRVGKDYRYSKNMGGAIYLYLRGVDSVTKTGGSYFHLLNEDFINRLDKVLNGEEDE